MSVKVSLKNKTYLKIEGNSGDAFFTNPRNQMFAKSFSLSETKKGKNQAYEGEIETTDLGEIVDWLDADAPGWGTDGPELKKYFTNRKKQVKTK